MVMNTKKNVKNTNTVFNEYIELYNKFQKLYGKQSIVLYQLGMFYEMYSLNNNETGPPLDELTTLLGGILYTKKNKSIPDVSPANPYMAGFPIASVDKYINIFIDNNYTVIIVDQYDNEMGANAKKERKGSEIISPSTYLKDDITSYKCNYLMSIYF